MRYDAQNILAQPALPRAELWRFLLGLALIAACYTALGHGYFTLLSELVAPQDWPALAREIDEGSSARAMLAILASFGLITISLALVLKLLHNRPLASLFGAGRAFMGQSLRIGTALSGFAILLWVLPEPAMLQPFHNIDYLRWLAILPLSVPLLLVQVSAEELLFRGYAQSQLSARFSQAWIWLLMPALAFGLLHYDPAATGGNVWAIMLSAALFGLAAGDLTARAGTLAPALALHLFFNATALLYLAPGDRLFGLALYTYPFELSDRALLPVWLPYELMTLLCAWLTARLALGR